jgi:hypothetical protein
VTLSRSMSILAAASGAGAALAGVATLREPGTYWVDPGVAMPCPPGECRTRPIVAGLLIGAGGTLLLGQLLRMLRR